MENTQNTEVKQEQIETQKTEEKKTLVHYFKAEKCQKCGETMIFFPKYKSFICKKCANMDGTVESKDRMDYLTDLSKKELEEKKKVSRGAVIYRDPKSDPLYGTPGRNDSCVCGSGKKFKKCCLGKLQEKRMESVGKMIDEKTSDYIKEMSHQVFVIRSVFDHQKKNNWKEVDSEKLLSDIEAQYKTLFPEDPVKEEHKEMEVVQ